MSEHQPAPPSRIGDDIHVDLAGRMTYGDYLQLNTLLAAKKPLTEKHDEHLFITIHHVQELWLNLMAHELNTAIDFPRAGRRARGRFVLASADDGRAVDPLERLPASTPDPEESAERHELASIVRRTLDGIEEARLRWAEDLPERQIAERLGVTRDAVATRLKRLRRRLRAAIAGEGNS